MLSSQKSVSLEKQCAAAIISLTQMHIAILWVLVLGGMRTLTIVLFDTSSKNGKKIFFFTFICFIGGMVLGVQLKCCLTYSFCFGNIKECLNAPFV